MGFLRAAPEEIKISKKHHMKATSLYNYVLQGQLKQSKDH